MNYPNIEVRENGKAVVCPVCKNKATDIVGDYCQICGTMITNRCSVKPDDFDAFGIYDCPGGEGLPGNARYCNHCGAPSTFLLNNLLKSWDTDDNFTS